ncbi:MAG: phage tail assembly chaperone [Phyllobacterium sp.]
MFATLHRSDGSPGWVHEGKGMLKPVMSNRSNVQRFVLPEAGNLIWSWFIDLHQARSWHMNGPNPISYSEILTYSQLMRWQIVPYEVTAICRLDQVFIDHFHDRQRIDNSGVKKIGPTPKGEMTPALFDAVFG